MKVKRWNKFISAALAVVLCGGIIAGTIVSSFAAGADYYGLDLQNKREQFEQIMSENAGNSVVEIKPEDGVDMSTVSRIKYILPGETIKEQYSDKTFSMQFGDVTLDVKGSFIAGLENNERVEFQVERTEPFNANNEDLVLGATSIIKGEDPDNPQHPVVGPYVYEVSIFCNNMAVYDLKESDASITVTLNTSSDYVAAAQSENANANFVVYAYLDNGVSGTATYDNMNATFSENIVSKFTLQKPGWFYLAADHGGIANSPTLWIIIAIVAVVVVVVIVVVIVLVTRKKKPETKPAE